MFFLGSLFILSFAETNFVAITPNVHITSFFFLCIHGRAVLSPNVCRSPAYVLSLQIQYSEDRSWTILTQARQWPICLNWAVKAHGIASVPSIRFHSTKSLRYIHVLQIIKYVFELGLVVLQSKYWLFSPKSAFHSTFVANNVTAQTGNEYTNVQIQPKQINLSEYC